MSKRKKTKVSPSKRAKQNRQATGSPKAVGQPKAAAKPQPVAAKARPSTATPRRAAAPAAPLAFGKDTYIWLAGAFGLILLGLILMTGGGQPDPNEWDPNIIYNWRRITLAPVMILAGIGLAIYAVFKK